MQCRQRGHKERADESGIQNTCSESTTLQLSVIKSHKERADEPGIQNTSSESTTLQVSVIESHDQG